MSGRRKYVINKPRLLDSPESLHYRAINNRDLMAGDEKIPQERIVEDLWGLRHI
jgi:hypothetical protein